MKVLVYFCVDVFVLGLVCGFLCLRVVGVAVG